jgi:hypothetical protein
MNKLFSHLDAKAEILKMWNYAKMKDCSMIACVYTEASDCDSDLSGNNYGKSQSESVLSTDGSK